MSRGVRLSLLGLAPLLALSACKEEEPPPPPVLRYAYVVAEPGAPCGQIKVVEAEGEFADNEVEAVDWDANSDECQTRPVFGSNSELSWLTHDAMDGPNGSWKIQLKVPGTDKRTVRIFNSVVDIGRIKWSPTGEHIAMYFQEPGQDHFHATFEVPTGGSADFIDLNQVAYAADEEMHTPGREMREATFSADGTRFTYPTYENDNVMMMVPRFNLDIGAIDGAHQGHFTFAGIEAYDRIRQVVFGSRDDTVWVHGQTPEGVSHVIRVDGGVGGTPTVIYEGGDVEHWFSPLQVSPDGRQCLFMDHDGQVVIIDPTGNYLILGLPKGDELSWLDRKLQWVGNERIAFTVQEGNKRIEMFDRVSGELLVVAEEEGMDVMELTWDINGLGREETGDIGGSGSGESGEGETGGAETTDGGGTETTG